MNKTLIYIFIFFLLAVVGCDWLKYEYVEESEVSGSYVANYDIPLDSLELLPDGRCIHVFSVENQEIQTDTTSWEYYILKSKDSSITSYIIFSNLLYAFDNLHTEALPVSKIKRINITLAIERKVWKGIDKGIYMNIDPQDGAFYYKKIY